MLEPGARSLSLGLALSPTSGRCVGASFLICQMGMVTALYPGWLWQIRQSP